VTRASRQAARSSGHRTRRWTGVVAGAALAVLALTGCDGSGRSGPTPTPAPSLEATVPAFERLSGLTVPSDAEQTSVRVVQDPSGVPAYRVDFRLPSSGVDAFCTDGGMQKPLDVYTVPPSIRDLFGYTGDGAPGVKIGEGALPGNVDVQRTVLATGTDTATAQVRVYSYRQPR
jgi:hypothetical protein